MRRSTLACAALVTLLGSSVASAETFPAGSVIIPMDTDHQDLGMFKAYGLVYQLLLHDVPVNWTIRSGKGFGEVDFTTDATDYATGVPITAHGYRGGPWVVHADDASAAQAIIDAWQASNVTTVHIATSAFFADVSKRLVAAPTIAMFADGNQKIARGYVMAAGIPDSTGNFAWPDASPDMLTVAETAGPTDTNHADGALFDGAGRPVYCQFMSMHWAVKDARDNPEVVAEVRQFLNHPTHFFAECQAVNAFENDLDNGLFLTPNGFEIDIRPTVVDFFNASSPFAQFDGTFATVGGSEPSYTLPTGDQYKAGGITMITGAGTPEGHRDVWMTGYLDGACPPDSDTCGTFGKISYLGGHEYKTIVPISSNPSSQGARLFLNSLFEAQCATAVGQPHFSFTKAAPAITTDGFVTYTISYDNGGPGVALDVVVRDELPSGSTFVSATQGGVLTGSEVSWWIGNLGAGEGGTLSFTVEMQAHGAYENTASLDYRVGMNQRHDVSNTVSTEYVDGDAGVAGSAGAAGAGSAGAAGDGGTAGAGGITDGGASGTGGAATGGASGSGGATGGASGSGGTGGASGSGGTGGSSGSGTGAKSSGSVNESEESGGCGCRTPGSSPTSAAWLLGIATLLMVRRRQSW
jgi:uncharacterized repeat protein (TIGR01451 family)/MYXO-CTERM domain-containing protein